MAESETIKTMKPDGLQRVDSVFGQQERAPVQNDNRHFRVANRLYKMAIASSQKAIYSMALTGYRNKQSTNGL